MVDRLHFDRDADSVDGAPTFEVRWVSHGRYTNRKLAELFRPTIEKQVLPLLRHSPLHVSKELVLCEALVRMYEDGARRMHPAHFDGDALVTAVFELPIAQYSGNGFYVQPGAHPSSRIALTAELQGAGDVIAHSFDLQHGVEVRSGRRCSVILWFTDSLTSCEDKSRPWYVAAAAKGDADALYNVGRALDRSGDDPKRARALLTQAAELGSFTAQTDLAAMLLDGRGCKDAIPQEAEAERWLTAAAEQGFYRAQDGLARLCARRGDEAAAWAWLLRAAEQRADPEVLYRVGMAYLTGEGGAARDAAAAKGWLREAAEMGHPKAQGALGHLVYDEVELLRQQAHAHDYQAAAEAERWLQRASDQGELAAARTLIPMYVTRGDLGAAGAVIAAWVSRMTRLSSKWR